MRVAKPSSRSGRLSIRVELSPTVYETSLGFDVGTAGSDIEAKKTTRRDDEKEDSYLRQDQSCKDQIQ